MRGVRRASALVRGCEHGEIDILHAYHPGQDRPGARAGRPDPRRRGPAARSGTGGGRLPAGVVDRLRRRLPGAALAAGDLARELPGHDRGQAAGDRRAGGAGGHRHRQRLGGAGGDQPRGGGAGPAGDRRQLQRGDFGVDLGEAQVQRAGGRDHPGDPAPRHHDRLAAARRMGHAGGGGDQRPVGGGLLRALWRPGEGGPMSRTLVTGGTGFVGGLLLSRLVRQGREVRAMVRRPGDRERLPTPEVELALGDLEDEEVLVRAAEGCEVVYHAAGMNQLCLPDPTPLYRVNVDGTARLLRAAQRAGVRRVVYTSSAATLGGDGGHAADETSPPPGTFTSHYARSKYEAERVALEFLGVEVVTLNPSSVQGPGRRTGTARVFIDYLNGRLRFDLPSRFGICYTEDCVSGHLLAESKGRAGERYVLNTATLSNTEAIDLIAVISGLTSRPRTLPLPLAMGVAVLRDLARRGIRAVLVERSDLGTGTSGRWHGLLHSGARYAVRDQESARECIVENQILRRIAPHTIEDVGGLFVLLPSDDEAYASQLADGCTQSGIPFERLSATEARQREPLLSSDVRLAYAVPDAGIDAWALLRSMARDATEHGAQVLPL